MKIENQITSALCTVHCAQHKKNLAVVIVFLLSGYSFVYAQSDRVLIREGNKDYQKKNYSEAELKYRKSLEKNPQSGVGNYNLGNALYEQGKQEEAVQYYSGGASMTKDKDLQSKAYYNLGNSLMKAEKYQESVNAYKQALKLNDKDEDARYNLAYALSKLRQQQQQQQNKDQDKKQDQKKDQQQQQKQQQQKDQQKQQEQQQQQANKQQKISKEDAERMLQALKNEEKNLQKKLTKKFDATIGNAEKDW